MSTAPVESAAVTEVYVRGLGYVTVHPTRFGGREVFASEDGQVFCDGCQQMLTLAELTRPGNGHRVAPRHAVAPMVVEVWWGDEESRWL